MSDYSEAAVQWGRYIHLTITQYNTNNYSIFKVPYYAEDSDIDLLKAIANSKKTIMRFSGDKHYYDYKLPIFVKCPVMYY